MDYEQIRSIFIENAWLNVNMDYGLLHVQLATPILVFFILLFMIFMLNKLLFQPVLQTLDGRLKIIDESNKSVSSTKEEIAKLSQEYEEQLASARAEINQMYQAARQAAQERKDEILQQARKAGEEEIEKGRTALSEEIQQARKQLQNAAQDLAEHTTDRLLN